MLRAHALAEGLPDRVALLVCERHGHSSWRQIVDLADPDSAVGVHTTGQSGHPSSEHWNDMVPMWASGGYHALPFTRRAVEAAAMSSMTLVPR